MHGEQSSSAVIKHAMVKGCMVKQLFIMLVFSFAGMISGQALNSENKLITDAVHKFNVTNNGDVQFSVSYMRRQSFPCISVCINA